VISARHIYLYHNVSYSGARTQPIKKPPRVQPSVLREGVRYAVPLRFGRYYRPSLLLNAENGRG